MNNNTAILALLAKTRRVHGRRRSKPPLSASVTTISLQDPGSGDRITL
jgi:hypothetical protein